MRGATATGGAERPLRVAYVSTDPGVPVYGRKGASAHVRAVLTQLVERGHDVHLVAGRVGGTAPAELAGLPVHPLPAVRGDSPAARERAAREADAHTAAVLGRLHGEAPLDLVYERYALWGRTATAWAAGYGVPSVLEVNAPLPVEAARHRGLVGTEAADAVARAACGAATRVVCVSDPVAEWVRGLGAGRPGAVHTVPNGVDTRRFSPAPVRPAADVCTVGFVGTLKPWHGVADLVRAVALLGAAGPAYRLLLVGDGPERPGLERLVAELGLQGAVELTGALDADQVPAQLARMDVAVAPYPATAGFYFSPLKIYEYLAAGVPVVASDAGHLPALLSSAAGPLGVTYPAGSTVALAAAIDRLRRRPGLRAALAARGRAAAVRDHDWSSVVDRILELTGVSDVSVPA